LQIRFQKILKKAKLLSNFFVVNLDNHKQWSIFVIPHLCDGTVY